MFRARHVWYIAGFERPTPAKPLTAPVRPWAAPQVVSMSMNQAKNSPHDGAEGTQEAAAPREDTTDPKVSLITVCLNSRPFIEETIQSVRSQSYNNIEYIVIDGGSTDGTQKILERHSADISYWVSEPDKGISDAFNKGILASTGEIIGFINSQDYYTDPEVIRKVVDAFTHTPSARIVYGKTYYVPKNSAEYVGVMGGPFSPARMGKRNIMPHQSVFMRREIFHKFGLYRLDYSFAMDYEHLLRATKVYRPLYLDEGLAVMRLGGVSDTRKFRVCSEIFKAQRANGEPFLRSSMTLLYHYLTSAGLGVLRMFDLYTLDHLFEKLGLKTARGLRR